MIALREQNAGPTLRTWGTWVDVKGLTESEGLSLARHKHLPTVSAVSVTVYWKTRALVETLDLRGTPGLRAGPELFVTYLVFVFGFGRVETIQSHSQYSSCTFFLSHVILRYFLWSRSQPQAVMWCKGVGGVLISLCRFGDKRRAFTQEKSLVWEFVGSSGDSWHLTNKRKRSAFSVWKQACRVKVSIS